MSNIINSAEVVGLINPRGDMEAISAMRAFIRDRGAEIRHAGEKLLKEIQSGAELSVVKAEAKQWAEGGMEDLRERAKDFVRSILDDTGATAVIMEIDDRFYSYSTRPKADTTYAKLAQVKKEIDAAIKERIKNEEPAAPVRAIPVVLYATDEAMRKLASDIRGGKRAGIEGYAFAPDEATEKKVVEIMSNKEEGGK